MTSGYSFHSTSLYNSEQHTTDVPTFLRACCKINDVKAQPRIINIIISSYVCLLTEKDEEEELSDSNKQKSSNQILWKVARIMRIHLLSKEDKWKRLGLTMWLLLWTHFIIKRESKLNKLLYHHHHWMMATETTVHYESLMWTKTSLWNENIG